MSKYVEVTRTIRLSCCRLSSRWWLSVRQCTQNEFWGAQKCFLYVLGRQVLELTPSLRQAYAEHASITQSLRRAYIDGCRHFPKILNFAIDVEVRWAYAEHTLSIRGAYVEHTQTSTIPNFFSNSSMYVTVLENFMNIPYVELTFSWRRGSGTRALVPF